MYLPLLFTLSKMLFHFVCHGTGGQSSKATAASAIAKFSAGGKETKKKDLGIRYLNASKRPDTHCRRA